MSVSPMKSDSRFTTISMQLTEDESLMLSTHRHIREIAISNERERLNEDHLAILVELKEKHVKVMLALDKKYKKRIDELSGEIESSKEQLEETKSHLKIKQESVEVLVSHVERLETLEDIIQCALDQGLSHSHGSELGDDESDTSYEGRAKHLTPKTPKPKGAKSPREPKK